MRFVGVGLQLKGELTMTNVKLKVVIEIELEKENCGQLRSLKRISEDIIEELTMTNIIPFRYGYKGKLSVTVANDYDSFCSWCLVEEIAEQEKKK